MKSRIDRQPLVQRTTPQARRGFTMIELIVAGVITAFVLGSISMSISQLGRAKNTSKLRFDAFIRADSALNAVRRDIVTVLRRDDLFFTRFQIINDTVRGGDEQFDRDEVLVFNTRLRAMRDIDFNGEGFEYETQYRITDDDAGPVLWVRHDAVPDEYPAGGGIVTPAVEGILSLQIEAYDGQAWYEEWDSDAEGLPLAVRITVVASGHRDVSDIYAAPRAVLQTVVSIDRVLPPKDLYKDPNQQEEESTPPTTDQPTDEETGAGGNGGPTGGGGPIVVPGGGRPGGNTGGPRPRPGTPGRPGTTPTTPSNNSGPRRPPS